MAATHEVYLAQDAERDLDDIFDHLETHDSYDRAVSIYERIKAAVLKLETTPARTRAGGPCQAAAALVQCGTTGSVQWALAPADPALRPRRWPDQLL